MHQGQGRSRTWQQGCPVRGLSLHFLFCPWSTKARAVVKKLNHESVPFGWGGGCLSNCLITTFTTHVTTTLVRVYEYTCSVTFMTLGNKGQGTLRREMGTDRGAITHLSCPCFTLFALQWVGQEDTEWVGQGKTSFGF